MAAGRPQLWAPNRLKQPSQGLLGLSNGQCWLAADWLGCHLTGFCFTVLDKSGVLGACLLPPPAGHVGIQANTYSKQVMLLSCTCTSYT